MALIQEDWEIHPEEFISRARKLHPALKQRAQKTREDRRVPRETIQELKDAGFFRMMRPKKWGGYEMNPKYFYDVVFEISRVCPSTGWVLSVVGVHDWQMALLEDQAAQDVWGDDLDTLICSSYMPTGKTSSVEGGVIFNGTWNFSSGCDHAKWAFLGGTMTSSEGPVDLGDIKSFLVPSSDFEIIDDWYTTGLQGSGSKTIVVKDVFVPLYRIHGFKEGYECNSPGIKTNKASIFKLPFGQVFTYSVTVAALGAYKGALEAFKEYGKTRVSSYGIESKTDPRVQQLIAEVSCDIEEMWNFIDVNFENMMSKVSNKEKIKIEDRIKYRYQASTIVDRCVAGASKLVKASGGASVYLGHEVMEKYLDIMTVQVHVANISDGFAVNYGGTLLGLENTDIFL